MNDPVWDAECDLIGDEAARRIAEPPSALPCAHAWHDFRGTDFYLQNHIVFACKKCKDKITKMDFTLMSEKEREMFTK